VKTWHQVLLKMDDVTEMNNSKQRVAIYARVSTEEQAKEGVSIDNQLATLRSYAQLQGWEIAGEYVDPGVSGATDDRPGFKRLLMDAKKHRFDIIAVSKLDRFFRNLRLLLNYIYEFDKLAIKFVSFGESLDTSTPYGKFAVQIMGVIAEFERGRIAERIKEGRAFRLSQGRWTAGSTPYGYKWLPKEQRWEIVEKEAEIVKYIYHLYLDEKLGIMQIPHRLYQEGYHAHRGGNFANSLVHRILSQPAYKGLHSLGIKMPVIIDENTWDKAEKKRASARHVRGEIRGWLLQGLCTCGLCGRQLTCSQKKGEKFRYYICRGKYAAHHPDGSAPCLLSNRKADDLETSVWCKAEEAINQSEVMREYINKALANLEAKKTQSGDEIQEIEKQLEGVKTKLERLALTFADGAIKEAVYKTNLEKLKKQELELMRRQQAIDPSTLMEILETQERIKAIKEILDHGSLQLNEFGFFALMGNKYMPIGFNPWNDTDGKMEVGELKNLDDIKFPGTDFMIKSMIPQGIGESTLAERTELLKKNWRGILQLFDIHVKVFNDRIEIRGLIPPQVIAVPEKKQSECAPISCSVRRSG
jgi:site-specific DNA recombinase